MVYAYKVGAFYKVCHLNHLDAFYKVCQSLIILMLFLHFIRKFYNILLMISNNVTILNVKPTT